MDNGDLVNSTGKDAFKEFKRRVLANFTEYPEKEREKIYLKITDYFLDRCTKYDPEHKVFGMILRARDETREYIKYLKEEKNKEKKNLKKILDRFKCDDDS